MSLKDEIENIIRTERGKLENRDQGNREYRERQRDRFQPLRALLEEFVTAIGPKYLKANIGDDRAIIEVGRRKKDSEYLECDYRWTIEPDYGIKMRSDASESLFEEKAGVRVEEKQYFRFPEYDTSEKAHHFEADEEAFQHLVETTAKEVAHYQHLEKQIEEPRKTNDSE